MTRDVSGRGALVMVVFLATGTFARADWRVPLAAGYKAKAAGKLAEAEAQMKQAVAMAKSLGAERNHEYAEALVGLSDVYLAQEKPTLAGTLLERALGILAESSQASGEVLAHLHTSLSGVRVSEGRLSDAQVLLKYVLTHQEKTLDPSDVRIADTLDSLAGLCLFNGQGHESASYQKRALDIRVKAAGNAPRPLSNALLNLAVYESLHGGHATAMSLRRRALALQEKTLGPNHPDVAETLMAIATTDVNVGESGGLAVSMRVFPGGFDDPDARDASKVRAKGVALFLKSKPLAERALAIREKALGADNLKTLETLDFLAAGYFQQEDARAEPYLRRVVEARTKTLSPQPTELFGRLVMLSRIYMRHEKYAEAILLLERVVAIDKARPSSERHVNPLQTRSDEDDPENYPAQLRKAIRLAREKPGE